MSPTGDAGQIRQEKLALNKDVLEILPMGCFPALTLELPNVPLRSGQWQERSTGYLSNGGEHGTRRLRPR